MSEQTTILPIENIAVRVTGEGADKWLTFDVPNDWDDVKRVCKRVLHYRGETYTFRGWNSDRHECFFAPEPNIATFGKRVKK